MKTFAIISGLVFLAAAAPFPAAVRPPYFSRHGSPPFPIGEAPAFPASSGFPVSSGHALPTGTAALRPSGHYHHRVHLPPTGTARPQHHPVGTAPAKRDHVFGVDLSDPRPKAVMSSTQSLDSTQPTRSRSLVTPSPLSAHIIISGPNPPVDGKLRAASAFSNIYTEPAPSGVSSHTTTAPTTRAHFSTDRPDDLPHATPPADPASAMSNAFTEPVPSGVADRGPTASTSATRASSFSTEDVGAAQTSTPAPT